MPGIKGKTNNPNGRPRTGEAFVEQLRAALVDVEKVKKKSLMRHAVERAYDDDSVLVALMKKLVPDLTEVDLGKRTFEHFVNELSKFQK